MAIFNPETKDFYCECGCGTAIPFYNRWAKGHHYNGAGFGNPDFWTIERHRGMSQKACERFAKMTFEERQEYMEPANRVSQTEEVYIRRSKEQKDFWSGLSSGEKEARLEKSLHSREAREKAAEANRKTWASYTPEERETRLKNSLHSREARGHLAEAMDRYCSALTEEERGQRVKSMIEASHTKEARKKASESLRRYWAGLSPEEKAQKVDRFVRAGNERKIPSEPEKQLWEFLEQAYPDSFIPNWDCHITIGGKRPDFVSKDGYKLVIETMGSYWHELEDEGDRVSLYKDLGWDCIVVWANSAFDIICEWSNLARQISRLLDKEVISNGL